MVWKLLLTDLWRMRQRDPRKRIVGSKMDVKSAYRQVMAALNGVLLAYVLDGVLVVDLRLEFGWRSSPGWWEVFGHALEWSVTLGAPGSGPPPSEAAKAAAAHVRVLPERPGVVRVEVPKDPAAAAAADRGREGEPVVGRIYVDDLLFLMIAYATQACLSVTVAAAHDHFMLLGFPGAEHPVVCPQSKMTDWDSVLVALGWLLDTDAMTVSFTAARLEELRVLVAEWLALAKANVRVYKRDVWRVLGKLLWASLVVRGSRAFLWRVIQLLGGKNARLGARGRMRAGVLLGDFNFWSWALALDSRVVGVPISVLVTRAPDRCWFSDASYTAIGGLCSVTGFYWRYVLDVEQRGRLIRSVRIDGKLVQDGWLHINLLELVGMVVTAWVIVVQCGQRPQLGGETVLLRGDNTSAVQWVRKRGGAADKRAQVALRLLAAVETGGGWSFDANHIAGKLNVCSDGITRLSSLDAVQRMLEEQAPRQPGQEPWTYVKLGGDCLRLIGGLLAKSTPSAAWESSRWADIWGSGGCGASGAATSDG
jgi:hypothetical protein